MPKARSRGVEVEFAAAPNENFDFSISGSFNNSSCSRRSPRPIRRHVSIVSGIEEGNRLPTVPEFQVAAAATYQWPMLRTALGYVTGTFQHIGSRFTQIGDQAAGFGTVNLNSFAPNTIGGPLTAVHVHVRPRAAVVRHRQPARRPAARPLGRRRSTCNNLTDERALLALDQERGTRARVGYLTNQPRTFGLTARVNF